MQPTMSPNIRNEISAGLKIVFFHKTDRPGLQTHLHTLPHIVPYKVDIKKL